jgi:inactivated superfamily I helicase
MLLSDGTRCKNGAHRNGLCDAHTKRVKEEKRIIDKLIAAGSYAAATAAFLNLLKAISDNYHIIKPLMDIVLHQRTHFLMHSEWMVHRRDGDTWEDTIKEIPIAIVRTVTEKMSADKNYKAVTVLGPIVFAALLEGQEDERAATWPAT